MSLITLLASETLNQWRLDINQLAVDVDTLQTGSGPFALLHVDSNVAYDNSPGIGDGLFLQYDTSQIAHIDSFLTNTDTALAFGTTNNADTTVTERLRINHDGNIGFGTTDIEAWASTYKALEFLDAGIAFNATGNTLDIISNAYNDGAWKYKTTDPSYKTSVLDVGFIVSGAASGTIDTAITFNDLLNISVADIIFNNANADVNLRIASDTKANAFYMDGALGNFGLNTNDIEAWDATLSAIEIGASSAIAGGTLALNELVNLYYDGAWKYKSAAGATGIFKSGTEIIYRVMPTGALDEVEDLVTDVNQISMGLGLTQFNVNSIDVDLQISGNTLANLFYVNGGTDNIGLNNAAPDVSSILDITSTTKGFLAPRMTSAQKNAITTPATGLLVFDTDTARFAQNDANDVWADLATIDDVVALAIALG